MDKTTLVDADLKAGWQVIEELERRGTPIDVAAWLQDDATGVWRLLVSSPTAGETGFRPIYEAILNLLHELRDTDLDLDNFLVAGPNQHLVKDLKRLVRTGDEPQMIRLDGLNLGLRHFRSGRIYRVKSGGFPDGGLEQDARVRVKSTGRLGTVGGVFDTPHGPRYLVLYDLRPEDIRPLREDEPPTDAGQDFGARDLELLYAVRPGGLLEKPPLIAQPA
jgi:hypothetical protein